MKSDIGPGQHTLPCYAASDITAGRTAFPLALPADSAEAIHASHVLEHFGHRQTAAVLTEWVRVLAPGGWLQVAVPDFNAVIQHYRLGPKSPSRGISSAGRSTTMTTTGHSSPRTNYAP